ncbi:hypothetical protein [Streptomyces sp. SYSU K217416]
MNTFLNLLLVVTVLALLAAPSLIGHLHDRRIDRQLKAAAAPRPRALAVTYAQDRRRGQSASRSEHGGRRPDREYVTRERAA